MSPDGATFWVDVWGDDCSGAFAEITDNGSGDGDAVLGSWSVDFSGDCPAGLGPNRWGQATHQDADGDYTAASVSVLAPYFGSSLTFDDVFGWGFVANGSVDVSINGTLAADDVATDSDGFFYASNAALGSPDLVAGDVIEVTDGVSTKSLTLVNLSIEITDVPAGASGVSPDGATFLRVSVWGDDCSGAFAEITDNGSGDGDAVLGSWSVDFSADCPDGLGPNRSGQATHPDADGDFTVASVFVVAPVTHFVSVQEFSFGPVNLTVAAGDIVVWTFDGSIVHTTTGPSWDSGNVSPGGSYQQTFGAAGTFNYFCKIHPVSMQATVTVTP